MNWGKIFRFVGSEIIKSLTKALLGELERRPDNAIDKQSIREFEEKAYRKLKKYKKG